MAVDTTELESPGWWLQYLYCKLDVERRRIVPLLERFEGEAPFLVDADPAAAESYRRFRRKARTNWAELVVEAVRKRMRIQGFRTGADADANGDEKAFEVFRTSGMKAALPDTLTSMLATGIGYQLVGQDDDETVVVTDEDPLEVVTQQDPMRPRTVAAAMKLFHDPIAQLDYAYLYLPGRVHVATRERATTARTCDRPVRFAATGFDWADDRGGEAGEEVPFDQVPVVPFRNRRGAGEFERHLDLLDRIDMQVFERLVIAAIEAYRQRAFIGTPDEDENGKPINWDEILTADPGAVWRLPKDSEVWESAQADLQQLLSAVKDDVKALGSVTATPMHILIPDLAGGSAESATLLREEHQFKTDDRIELATEPAVDVMSLALTLAGEPKRADRAKLEVLWTPTELIPLTERAAAGAQAQDIPFRSRMIHVWGFTPAQVDIMESELEAQQAAEPPAPEPPAPGPPEPPVPPEPPQPPPAPAA